MAIVRYLANMIDAENKSHIVGQVDAYLLQALIPSHVLATCPNIYLFSQSFPEEWRAELDLSILEGNRMFRECFMLHRTTKSVFAMDSLVEMGEANIPHPVLQAGSKMAGNFGRVSARLSFGASLYCCHKYLKGDRLLAFMREFI